MISVSEEGKRLLHVVKKQADEGELKKIEIIHRDFKNKKPRSIVFIMFSDEMSFKAFYSWYIDNDKKTCKQHFYVSARLKIFASQFQTISWNMGSTRDFLSALLSDSSDMILLYSQFTTSSKTHEDLPSFVDAEFMSNKHDHRFLVHYLQHLMKKNWERANKIQEVTEQKIKKLDEIMVYWFRFGQALQIGNEEEMKTVINELLQPKKHKKYNKDNPYDLFGEVWSHYPTMFTKLAWMHGYELQIDNPLVPMELMPIEPLDHYDDVYDFLKPDFNPNASTSRVKSFISNIFGK